ncbi:MAG TPA: hypothetical protein VN476_03460 [Pyrinomonadaceae bacterium]|nr:hypothetical protein [Pyrinomonadaceae bacterium]
MANWVKADPEGLHRLKTQAEANARHLSGRVNQRLSSIDHDMKIHHQQVALSAANLANWQNDATVPEEKIEKERRRLADALMRTGEIDKAIEIAPEGSDTRERAVALKAAIELDDKAACDCKAHEHRGRVFSGSHALLTHIFSKKHGKTMPVRRCGECGHLNVTEENPHPQMTPEQEKRLGHASEADRAKYAQMYALGLKARALK